MTAEELSLRVVDVLIAQGIEYMLVGSLSTNFHSAPRATNDADIVIQTSLGEAARLVAVHCPDLQLDPQYYFESVTGTTKRVLETADGFIVELFGLSDDSHDQERYRRRLQVEWENRRVWIASAEDALVTKLRWGHLAGRRKDLVDASAVIAVRGEMVRPARLAESAGTTPRGVAVKNQPRANDGALEYGTRPWHVLPSTSGRGAGGEGVSDFGFSRSARPYGTGFRKDMIIFKR